MEIIRLLVNAINMYPDMRFGQLIQSFDVVKKEETNGKVYISDSFYEESVDTLRRIKKAMGGPCDQK
jgi:hypothetical protein